MIERVRQIGIRTLLGCLVLISIIAASIAAAPLWHHVIVVSTEGWRYDDVTVVLADHADSLIVHHADGSETVLALTGIASVRNLRDEDITKYVYDPGETDTERYAPPPPPPPTVAKRTPPPPADFVDDDPTWRSRPRLGRPIWIVALQVGAGTAIGSWYTGLRGGESGQLAVRRRAGRSTYGGFVYMYQALPLRGRADTQGQHEIYAVVGIDTQARGRRVSFRYAEAGLGWVGYSGASRLDSRNLLIRLAVGAVKPLSDKIGLVVQASGRLSGDWWQGDRSAGLVLGLSAGFTWMVRKPQSNGD